MLTFHRGWIRLWIIVSFLLGAVVFVLIMNTDTDTYYGTSFKNNTLSSPAEYENALQYVREIHAEIADCDPSSVYFKSSSVQNDAVMVSCKKSNAEKAIEALCFALVPALLIFIVGLAVTWVRRGFKLEKF